MNQHSGGRLAANFRRANIAEGVAMQMFRPFAAIAPVPRDEDHGIDFVATLLKRENRILRAENSFLVQIKTHTAARFNFSGDGIEWLRQLRLPYFPVVANLDDATVSLYTLNRWHMPIHTSIVNRYSFCIPSDADECDGLDDFPLGAPLMIWSMADCTHEAFPDWAYSILKPAVVIETNSFQFGPMWRFTELVGGPYRFDPSNPNNGDAPRVGAINEYGPGNGISIMEMMNQIIGPFANHVSNRVYDDDRSEDLLNLRESLRRLGMDPDPENKWNELAEEMAEYAPKGSANTGDS